MALTANEIKAKIGLFCTNRDALKALAQEIIVDIVHYCAPKALGDEFGGSGRPQMLLTLAKEMPKSWGVQVQTYLAEFTPIRMSVKNDRIEYTKSYGNLSADDKPGAWDMEGFNSTTFYDFAQEESPDGNTKLLDFAALLHIISKTADKIEKDADEGKVAEADVVNARNIAATLRSIKVDRIVTETPAANDAPAAATPALADAA